MTFIFPSSGSSGELFPYFNIALVGMSIMVSNFTEWPETQVTQSEYHVLSDIVILSVVAGP